MGKQRAMYSYDIPEDIAYEEHFDNEQEAIYGFLRTKIAMLSSMRRKTVILKCHRKTAIVTLWFNDKNTAESNCWVTLGTFIID